MTNETDTQSETLLIDPPEGWAGVTEGIPSTPDHKRDAIFVGRDRESRALRSLTLLVVIGPFIAFLAAVVVFWNNGISWFDLAMMAGLHVIAASGITVGFHRLLTHRSFETSKAMRYYLASAGSLAIEGRPSHWVADHRKHHAFSDEEGDPHSPHVGQKAGFLGMLKGLYHAHVGWLFIETETTVERYAPDLLKDSVIAKVDRKFGFWVLMAFFIPFIAGLAYYQTFTGALLTMFWAGGVRVFLTHHITWSVNSICHMFGSRPFENDDKSTNNWLLAIPTLGEAWHHNHHAFPTSAFHGLKKHQIDPSGIAIWTMEKLGLAWNVKRITPERMATKLRDKQPKSAVT